MATGCHVKSYSKLYLSSYWECACIIISCDGIISPLRVAYGSKNSSPYVHNLIGGFVRRMVVHMSEVQCRTISYIVKVHPADAFN